MTFSTPRCHPLCQAYHPATWRQMCCTPGAHTFVAKEDWAPTRTGTKLRCARAQHGTPFFFTALARLDGCWTCLPSHSVISPSARHCSALLPQSKHTHPTALHATHPTHTPHAVHTPHTGHSAMPLVYTAHSLHIFFTPHFTPHLLPATSTPTSPACHWAHLQTGRAPWLPPSHPHTCPCLRRYLLYPLPACSVTLSATPSTPHLPTRFRHLAFCHITVPATHTCLCFSWTLSHTTHTLHILGFFVHVFVLIVILTMPSPT